MSEQQISVPHGVKHLLVVLIALILLLVVGFVWWASRQNNEQNNLAHDVAELSFALGQAHQENPSEVPAPSEIIEDPPIVYNGEDGRDGRDGRDGQDGRTPTATEIALATEAWLNANVTDQPDHNDPEIDDPEANDPDPNDPDPDDPEIQDAEIQDSEIQDAEVQDPEIDDADPGVESFQFVFEFGNKTYTVTCSDSDGDHKYTCLAVESDPGGA